jgi:Capsular polysaccharide biosynthesis protein
MVEKYDREEIELNLWELIRVLWSKVGIIVLSGIVLGSLVLIGTKLLIVPQYEAETKVYVLSKQNDIGLTLNDMQASMLIAKDYAELIKSYTVTEEVIILLGLNITNKELLNRITVIIPNDTRIIKIRVRDPNPEIAAKLANTIRDVSSTQVQKLMNIEAVNTVMPARVPSFATSPNLKKNAVIGGALGVFLVCVFIIIRHLLNEAPKTSKDAERYYQIRVLDSISATEEEK